MKAKIFAKLKQEYSALGLGDEILLSHAESLATTGLVNDDNIDMVVASMKRTLEDLQKHNDKRVNDALSKERKKHEEEEAARKKAEEEAKAAKEKEEAEKKAKEEADAKAKAEAEAKAKAEEEAKKAKEEADKKAEEERKKLEGKVPDEVLQMLKNEREAATAREEAYKKQMQEMMAQFEARTKESNDIFAKLQEQNKTLLDSNNQLAESYKNLKTENDAAKAAKAKADRENFILAKAKELGVPDWRIDEGFLFAEDANEDAISETLAKVANNIKSQQLPPKSQNPFPQSDGKPTKEDIAALAKSIVK